MKAKIIPLKIRIEKGGDAPKENQGAWRADNAWKAWSIQKWAKLEVAITWSNQEIR